MSHTKFNAGGRKLLRVSALLVLALSSSTAVAEDLHPIMENKWWLTAGSFLAERNFEASAGVTVGGFEREYDFEKATGLGDDSNLFMAELAWQYADNWTLALQHFRSRRTAAKTLDETFEWQGLTFDVGVQLAAETEMEITRIFLARRFRYEGRHRLRLGAGIHWLSVGAAVAGEARLNDQSRQFRRAAATADVPVPNIGAWYRFSPNRNWVLTARVDWLSAGIDNFSGRIWNASAGAGFRLADHLGIGLNYQYFELAGSLTEPNWRGALRTTFTGPHLYLSGYW